MIRNRIWCKVFWKQGIPKILILFGHLNGNMDETKPTHFSALLGGNVTLSHPLITVDMSLVVRWNWHLKFFIFFLIHQDAWRISLIEVANRIFGWFSRKFHYTQRRTQLYIVRYNGFWSMELYISDLTLEPAGPVGAPTSRTGAFWHSHLGTRGETTYWLIGRFICKSFAHVINPGIFVGTATIKPFHFRIPYPGTDKFVCKIAFRLIIDT